jgi:DNA topoisomerase IB
MTMSDTTTASRPSLLPAKDNVALGNNATYWMDVADDRFVHFTTASRADAIARSRKLLQNPPDIKKFGPDAVFGISTTYGKYVPGTQTTHTGATDEDPLVAVVFTTDDIPKVGFVEEVIWPHDVHLRTVDVVPASRGAALITASSENIDDDDLVVYAPSQRPATAVRVAARYMAATQSGSVHTAAKPRFKGKKKTEAGNTVYLYSERQIANRNKKKAERLEKLRGKIGDLRKQVSKDLKSDDPETALTALAVALIDETYERVGNDGSAEDRGHYGVTGWTRGHVSFGKGKATIKYTGKAGVKHEKAVTTSAVVKALRNAYEAVEGKESPLFAPEGMTIDARKVNSYLKNFDITAKDLRGLHANREMQERLRAVRSGGGKLPSEKGAREKKLKAEFKKALEGAAEAVGHEPATLRSQYLVDGLEEAFMADGKVPQSLDKTAQLVHRFAAFWGGED